MAEAGSGERIRAEGLWSTSALLDRAGLAGDERDAIEASRRPLPVPLPDGAVIRDNGVLNEDALARLLPDGTTARDWYRLLNAHAFLWPNWARCRRLLGARPYKGRAHDLLEFDTASLLAEHAERIRVTPINTGATAPSYTPRGPEMFTPLSAWPLSTGTPWWSTPNGRLREIAEVAVLVGVPAADRHLLRIVRCRHGEEPVTIWCRDADLARSAG
jgi:hypothetical protein